MLFLNRDESTMWRKLAEEVLKGRRDIDECLGELRSNFDAPFHFYCGSLLAAKGQAEKGLELFSKGALLEDDGLFSNAFIAGFLTRHDCRLEMPVLCFEDPQPFIHFTTTPQLKSAREAFVRDCGRSLPDYKGRAFSIMDIGTGNGALLADMLIHLRDIGKIDEIDEILLVDPSPAMLELARETVGKHFPADRIKGINSRIQGIAGKLDRHYDVALSSLAYHHMPYEDKQIHLKELRRHIDSFIIFEFDSNNDTPELYSPELALAVYQSYGRVIDFIFEHDAPLEVAQDAVDNFLMTEEVSFLTQTRRKRTDYHMLHAQWIGLFESVLAPDFICRSDSYCYSDGYFGLFSIHYGRS